MVEGMRGDYADSVIPRSVIYTFFTDDELAWIRRACDELQQVVREFPTTWDDPSLETLEQVERAYAITHAVGKVVYKVLHGNVRYLAPRAHIDE